MRTMDLHGLQNLRELIYGPSQSGKTRYLGTHPKLYVFNFEGKNIITMTYAGQDAEYDDFTSYEQVLAKIVELKKTCGSSARPMPDAPYQTIGLDSITRMYDVVMEAVLRLSGREVPQIQDWGLAHERTKLIIKALRELPCHLVVTALQGYDKDEATGVMVGGISMPGKMMSEIPPLFNFFGRMIVEPGKGAEGRPRYWLSTTPTTIFPAGDKTGRLDPREYPDFTNIWEKITKVNLPEKENT